MLFLFHPPTISSTCSSAFFNLLFLFPPPVLPLFSICSSSTRLSSFLHLLLLFPPSALPIPLPSAVLTVCGVPSQELVKTFNFHHYDTIKHSQQRIDPRRTNLDRQSHEVMNLLFGAAGGDVTYTLRRYRRGTGKRTRRPWEIQYSGTLKVIVRGEHYVLACDVI